VLSNQSAGVLFLLFSFWRFEQNKNTMCKASRVLHVSHFVMKSYNLQAGSHFQSSFATCLEFSGTAGSAVKQNTNDLELFWPKS
jgi:hypothetical protein